MNEFTLKAKNREELDDMIKRRLTLEEDETFKVTVLKEPKKILFFNVNGEYLIEIIKKESQKTLQNERNEKKNEIRTDNRKQETRNSTFREKKKHDQKEKRNIKETGKSEKPLKRSQSTLNTENVSSSTPVQPASSSQQADPNIDRIRGFMKELIVNSKLELKVVNVSKDGDRYIVNVDGKDIRYLIGEKGSALNAVEYLLSSVKPLKNVKVVIDSNNYKKKREEALRDLARKKGKKVLDSGRIVKLNPMSARERKIIHEEISFIKGLKTESMGEEPKRYLIIKRIKDMKNENEV